MKSSQTDTGKEKPHRCYTLEIVFIVSVAFIAMILDLQRQIPDGKVIETNFLNAAEHSHFIGCVRASTDYDTCRIISKQYRDDLAKASGLE